MKIVLLGYMGSGKSSVGKILASRLKLDFIDLDTYIEENEQMSVSQIFNEKGEIYFRIKETEYLKKIVDTTDDFVLSIGGGTPCYAKNIELIANNSESFYLKTGLNSLYNRLKRQRKSRPLIATIKLEDLKEFIAKHLFERTPYYNRAKFIIPTDNKTVAQVVNEIEKRLI